MTLSVVVFFSHFFLLFFLLFFFVVFDFLLLLKRCVALWGKKKNDVVRVHNTDTVSSLSSPPDACVATYVVVFVFVFFLFFKGVCRGRL